MECDHKSVSALEPNIIGVGYEACCLNCGAHVFVKTGRKSLIDELVSKGYTEEIARQMINAQQDSNDEEERIAKEKEALEKSIAERRSR